MTQSAQILAALRDIKACLQRRPSLDIPPLWVRRASLGFEGFKSWTDAYKILCDYYGIRELSATVRPNEVPKGAVACYVRIPPHVLSKEPTVSHETGVHEFFHHLYAEAGCTYDKAPSEAMTRAYVRTFLEGVE